MHPCSFSLEEFEKKGEGKIEKNERVEDLNFGTLRALVSC
jgi:hypothetical protein